MNAPSAISVTESGMLIEVKREQEENDSLAIVVTDDGITIDA